MAQYYQCVVQNVDELKRMYPDLNLDNNVVIMNDDGTQFSSQSVINRNFFVCDSESKLIKCNFVF